MFLTRSVTNNNFAALSPETEVTMLTKPFEDTLVDMHDGGYSLPSIQVAVDRHLALLAGADVNAERDRLARDFSVRRPDTPLAADILKIIRGA